MKITRVKIDNRLTPADRKLKAEQKRKEKEAAGQFAFSFEEEGLWRWLESAQYRRDGEWAGWMTIQPTTTLEFDLDYVQTLAPKQ